MSSQKPTNIVKLSPNIARAFVKRFPAAGEHGQMAYQVNCFLAAALGEPQPASANERRAKAQKTRWRSVRKANQETEQQEAARKEARRERDRKRREKKTIQPDSSATGDGAQ